MKTLKIKVTGRVQGQSLRASTRGYCKEHGINGYVSNMDDGTVEIIAQGEEGDLKKLIKWLEASPGFSKVESVSFKEIKGEKYEEFKVVRDGNIFNDQKKALGNLIKKI